jgi:CheY-like chemotaxis protein
MKTDIGQNDRHFAQQTMLPRAVLVVDDDAEMRRYIRECLDVFPVRVQEAVDGIDALERIEAEDRSNVALVITDIIMPRMDGLELKAAMKADERWDGVPVLLITGEAIRSSDGPVLRKPFNARKLRGAARALLALDP